MSEIESVLHEDRRFTPPEHFADKARVKSMQEYEALYERAKEDPAAFWGEVAKELHWFEPWSEVLSWNLPDAKWFVGATTNLSYNCLDRHLGTGRRNKAALIWEGEPGEQRILTYHQLHREVCKLANLLEGMGVGAGDRVAIYMPMIPESAIAMLACARIGATHSVIFGGFSAEALAERVSDAGARTIITADGGWRRGKVIPLKANVDKACERCEVERVLVVRRCGNQVAWQDGRDHWWHERMAEASATHEAAPLDAEHPLFLLYTSGTTGKPKGILHTTGGYMVHTYFTARMVFDLREDDTFWCSADVGWVTGHSYLVYGPLANGSTCVMYEGAPNYPEPDRFWDIIERYGVTIFYTAPTAIRAFERWGDEWPQRHDLSSLRLLGTAGEPINPKAWIWYHTVIGGERCPIVDTWWQTETGGMMISPLPGATPTKPGSATRPLPGIMADVVRRDGTRCEDNEGGLLVVRQPWPGMLRTIYGDHERFTETYFGQVDGVYYAGDGARRDEDGYIWVMGRMDDVINVSGHRLSTMEVEAALDSHDKIAEAAVVGRPDELSGQAIVAFVTPMAGAEPGEALSDELRQHVAEQIGALARPAQIRFADSLPKTRSGKIMRRLLRDIAAGAAAQGDTSTLEDSSVLDKLAAERGYEE
ncbi:acetate--CoA ligase [Haliangium ochraceum]|uniref:Acetyl-coenzyme A synthetase n=1 Tax=Haliangium ochraceum (strain DSM 14365 / JCM 11303 / SMP-2) TaxID=502025 RepID=D0LZP3_HALO1|nr:acetate--CoA ligase [Haliangium ochraceum]ACY18022.1 acetate/CoA ligase [Haliangium ochraceum DSM 14365]